METTRTVGLWRGVVSAIADVLWEASGRLMVRTTAVAAKGATALTVEGTHRWPDTGHLVINGQRCAYTGRTTTSFTGVTALLGPARVGSVVVDYGRATTKMDDLRAAFLVGSAVGDQLDTLARNHGIHRPRGLDDDTFRALLKVMLYLDAGTIRACAKVMDVLKGPSGYDIYEDLETEKLTVYVRIDPAADDDPAGKTYLVGGEAATAITDGAGGWDIALDHPPTIVYGVWDDADYQRAGPNAADLVYPTGGGGGTVTTNSATPDRVILTVDTFVVGDVGLPVRLRYLDVTDQNWKIAERISASTVRLVGRTHGDATLNGGEPTVIRTDGDWFRPWHVGHKVTTAGTNATNAGTYVIASVQSPRQATLTGAAFTSEASVTWTLVPNFGTATTHTLRFPRVAITGSSVKVKGATAGGAVLVDYTTVESAHIVISPSVDGEAPMSPVYLWYDGYIVERVLDLVTAAGVRVVVTT